MKPVVLLAPLLLAACMAPLPDKPTLAPTVSSRNAAYVGQVDQELRDHAMMLLHHLWKGQRDCERIGIPFARCFKEFLEAVIAANTP